MAVVKIAVLMIVVASVCLDVCKACDCETPPVYHPPKAPPVYYPPKAPKTPKAPKSPPLYSPPKSPPVYFPPKTPPTPVILAPPPPSKTCPVSLVQLSVCSPLLGGILSGTSKSCCALLGLLGVEAEICLCLAIDANILGLITVNAKIDVIASIFIDCGYKVPPNLSCPS